jgi:hypothetical protein
VVLAVTTRAVMCPVPEPRRTGTTIAVLKAAHDTPGLTIGLQGPVAVPSAKLEIDQAHLVTIRSLGGCPFSTTKRAEQPGEPTDASACLRAHVAGSRDGAELPGSCCLLLAGRDEQATLG